MKTNRKNFATRAVIASLAFGVVLSPIAASAATTSQNTTVNATLNAAITMTTSTTVNMSITPTASGAMSSASDTVTVNTNNATGYTLSLADGDASTNLVSGGNTIAADAGTQASPSNTLTNNAWGYRVDGIGGFGAGPTNAESSVASSAYKWAGVPATGTPNTIRTTNTNGSGSATTVWYGTKVDMSKPTGTYSDTVTYTAVTN